MEKIEAHNNKRKNEQKICKEKSPGPGRLAPLVRVSSQYTKVAGSVLVRAHARINQ